MSVLDIPGLPPVPSAPVHTEASMIDRLHRRYGITYRNGDYVGRRYSRADHVAEAAGFNYGTRIADYIAIDNFMPPIGQLTEHERTSVRWRERNGSIIGHEVKVSRSDWLAELRDPSKAEVWMRHCHTWYLVAPKDVVRDDLPEGWGLLVPHGVSLRVAVPAPRRDPEPLRTTTLAALARAITKTETRLALEGER